ncbi:S10 family peptidase [Oryzifoliimicrobium ureilyticus]|uniref:S10 family peptidase n=1 Tax=Oryzifoliimicrobium ureilyticus TaxID=3113724 RepID=UPI0030766575
MTLRRLIIAALAVVLLPAFGQAEQPADAHEAVRPVREGVLKLLPMESVTDHQITLGGRSLSYQATAGTLDIFGKDGNPVGALYYTAYVAKDGGPNRPITFAFNGGPGAASAYLHLGLVGPKILDFGSGRPDGATAKLVDNPQSWIAFTDLVLIDPIGTGWSRTVKADDAEGFYKSDADAQVMAKAIALYTARNHRSVSPKYLLGESYGGFRAVKVASALKDDQGIILSGAVMLSPFLDGRLLFDANEFPLGAALELPSLAAAQMERQGKFDEARQREAEQFALGEYLTTLAGAPPVGEAASRFYEKVSEWSGLPVSVVEKNSGFLANAYAKQRSESGSPVVASAYDAAFLTPDPFPEVAWQRSDDAILDGFTRAYGGAFADYARNELNFRTDMTYSLLDGDISRKWEWGRHKGGSIQDASVTSELRELLAINPSFRVLIAHGYSDVVTPYSASRYIVDHLPASLNGGRVALKLYRGGHMFYTHDAERAAFAKDAEGFFTAGQP